MREGRFFFEWTVVESTNLTDRRKRALERLMDDESEVVQAAIAAELRRCGEEGCAFLKDLAEGTNRILAAHAKSLMQQLGSEDTVGDFRDFIQSFRYELETGCLMLDRTVYPKLDASEVCLFLDSVAARCREIMVLPGTAIERCKVLNRVLFHEFGFRGDVENFYNPDNSFLSQVIKRRRGIPITLSIIYILVGQRCNIQLEPISVPGRFMVGCFEGEEPFYIDCFERGCFRSVEDVRRIIEANFSDDPEPHLKPAPVGEVLCRCCRNLVNQYASANDERMVRVFSDFVNAFDSTYRRQQ